MKYRKKPVVVECMLYKDSESRQNIIDWSNGDCYFIVFGQGSSFKCKTLEGESTISKGDYIIKGIKGEFYPCKPDIFEATYEKVKEGL